MSPRRFALVAVVSLCSLACNGEGPDSPTAASAALIRSTTSFGFCLGYCRSALEIEADRATYRLFDDRGDRPDLERTVPLTATQWQELASALSREQMQALPAVIGCPDCADGGAESLEELTDGWSRAVTFEYGAALPELQPLLGRVRSLRDRLDQELRPRE